MGKYSKEQTLDGELIMLCQENHKYVIPIQKIDSESKYFTSHNYLPNSEIINL